MQCTVVVGEALEYVTAKCSALNRTSTTTSQGSENVPEWGAQTITRIRGWGSAVKCCLLDKTWPLHSPVHSSHGDPHRIKPVRTTVWIREEPIRLHPHLRSQLLTISNFWGGGVLFLQIYSCKEVIHAHGDGNN